jgi:hypothetical protein
MSAIYKFVLLKYGAVLDRLYSQLVHNLSARKFFARGWGDISDIDADEYIQLLLAVQHRPWQHLAIDWTAHQLHRTVHGLSYETYEGQLRYLGDGISRYIRDFPERCHSGRVWLVRPTASGQAPTGMSACVVQLAATGEHGKGYVGFALSDSFKQEPF